MREYGKGIGDLTNFIFQAYDAIEPALDLVEKIKSQVENAVNQAITATLGPDVVLLMNDLSATSAAVSHALTQVVAQIATSQIDFFYPFYPKIQKGEPESKWYWFDYLHYRRTGDFVSWLWKLAQGDNDLMQYAIGYASHIGTDIVGHPYVNVVVGGPYRCHWHRHKLVENWIDAWSRNHYSDFTGVADCISPENSEVFRPHSIAGSHYFQLCEFPGEKLPAKLSKLFLDAITKTYPNPAVRPATLNSKDLDDAYRLWLMWFERATRIGYSLPPMPPPYPGSAAQSLINGWVNAMNGIWGTGTGGGGGGGGGFSVQNFFHKLFQFIQKLAQTVAATVAYITNNINQILALGATTAIELVRWLLYQVRLGLWQIADESRFALVLGGYLFPDENDLTRTMFGGQTWTQAFVSAQSAHLTGGGNASLSEYPHKREKYKLIGATELHLRFPVTPIEMNQTEPCPNAFFSGLPDTFIDSIASNSIADQFFSCGSAFPPPVSGKPVTRAVESQTLASGQLGSAVGFSTRLIDDFLTSSNAGMPFPNMNMDGDRGYGFETWRLHGFGPQDPMTSANLVPPEVIEHNPVEVDYGPTA